MSTPHGDHSVLAPPAQGSPARLPLASTVLIIDSDSEVTDLVETHLRTAGYKVLTAENAKSGREIALRENPNLIIVDLVLPGMSGTEFCKAIKQDSRTSEIPFIILTERNDEVDRIVGFELGADDYVSKPFSPRELVHRVRAILRRTAPALPKNIVTIGPITLDYGRCHARVHGKVIHLTPKEFKMLSLLAERPGMVQRRETLLQQIWGDEDAIDGRSIDTYLRRLRAKLGPAASCIKTVYGFGYRLGV